MSIPTFNKFKSTTIYGALNNADYPDNSVQASANIQRNLTVGGDIVVADGNIKGKKLFYNNVDIASTYVTNTTLTSYASLFQPQFKGNIDITVIDPILNPYTFSIANGAGNINMTTYNNGSYTIKINASNLQLSKNNGTNYYDILTTNTGALLSGCTFTGNVSGLTAITTDNSTKFATTAFVKAQNYISSNPDLSPYALLSGATFTGNVSGLTAITTDNSTLFATTSFVKAQNYITSSSLSPYALSSALSNYALSSSLSNYALSSSLSNYALSSSLSNYALLSGATFTGAVEIKNTVNITQPSSTSSAMLQFLTDTGASRANIYSSVGDSVFRFAIQSGYNTNGFDWAKGGTTLMTLDLNGNLTISGKLTSNTSASIPLYSTITVPTTNTLDNFQGNYYTTYSVRPTNSVNTLNGVSTVNIGIPFIGGNTQSPNFNPITISSVYFALGTLANPDTPQNTVYCVISPSYGATPTNTTNFFNINMYNVNGTRIRGYGTLLKSFSTNSYSIIFVATGGGFVLNTSYYYDPFQFTYV
jgi:hypothetical protein